MITHQVRIDFVDKDHGHVRATLLPHEPTGESWNGTQWLDCGTTADRWPCVAWAVSTHRQCPKKAAVRLPAAYVVPGPSPETFHVQICGGHFDVHRVGKPLGIVL